MSQPSVTKIHLKITYLKFHSNFLWANELKKTLTYHTDVIECFARCFVKCKYFANTPCYQLYPCTNLTNTLTHWGHDKIPAILQTFSHSFFFKYKLFYFDPNFAEICSQESNPRVSRHYLDKLEQLTCLHSEIPPPPHDYPYYWPVHIGSQVKTRQSQSYKFKEFAKTFNFWILKKKTCSWHTFWSCLIRCANMKWIRWVL